MPTSLPMPTPISIPTPMPTPIPIPTPTPTAPLSTLAGTSSAFRTAGSPYCRTAGTGTPSETHTNVCLPSSPGTGVSSPSTSPARG